MTPACADPPGSPSAATRTCTTPADRTSSGPARAAMSRTWSSSARTIRSARFSWFLRGLSVGVWGPGWERAADDPHVRPMIRGGSLRPPAWRRLYAACRVALNIHYGAFGPRDASGDLANTRVFEILGCGAYQVVDRQGDVLRLFRDGEHVALYSSGDELRARVDDALRDDARRREISRRGRDEVLSRHTYAHRAGVLVDPLVAGAGRWHESGDLVPASGRPAASPDPGRVRAGVARGAR